MSVISPATIHGSMALTSWNLTAVNNKTVSMIPYYKLDYDTSNTARISKTVNLFNANSLIMELPQNQVTIIPYASSSLDNEKAYICIVSEFTQNSTKDVYLDNDSLSLYLNSLKSRSFFVSFDVPLYNLKCKLNITSKSIDTISILKLEIIDHISSLQPKINMLGENYKFLINKYIDEGNNLNGIVFENNHRQGYMPITVAHVTEVDPDKVNIIKECLRIGLDSIIDYVLKKIK